MEWSFISCIILKCQSHVYMHSTFRMYPVGYSLKNLYVLGTFPIFHTHMQIGTHTRLVFPAHKSNTDNIYSRYQGSSSFITFQFRAYVLLLNAKTNEGCFCHSFYIQHICPKKFSFGYTGITWKIKEVLARTYDVYFLSNDLIYMANLEKI